MKRKSLKKTHKNVIFTAIVLISSFFMVFISIKVETTSAANTFTKAQVAKHSKNSDCWVYYASKVYDMTDYFGHHPGGNSHLSPYCGGDMAPGLKKQGHSSSKMNDLKYLGKLTTQTTTTKPAIPVTNTTGNTTPNTPTASSPDDVTFRLIGGKCTAAEALTCWLQKIFEFSQTAILLLSTAVIVFAGVIYMTSAGNPKQIELSKKLIIGALSGVAVIVLGKFFLVTVVGVPLSWL